MMEDHSPTLKQPPELRTDFPPALPPAFPIRRTEAVDENGLTEADYTLGMLVHLLGILTGFIGVLILWLVKRDRSRFVDFHGREALNFMISVFIYSMVLVVLAIGIGLVTLGLGMFVILPLIVLFAVGALVCEILACVAASKGRWHRYPFTIRFIRDAR